MQVRAVDLELDFCAVSAGKPSARKLPELRRVIHVHDMRDLVCGKIVEHKRRGENEEVCGGVERGSTPRRPSYPRPRSWLELEIRREERARLDH
jgi:hypothetical protein